MKSPKKLNQRGIAHWILPVVAVLLVGIVGGMVVARSHANTCVQSSYRRGSSGQCVRNIQNMMNVVTKDYASQDGYAYCSDPRRVSGNQIAADGSFGPATEAKVKNYQYWTCLSQDGVVGPKTWEAICVYAGSSYYHRTYLSTWNIAKASGCVVQQ